MKILSIKEFIELELYGLKLYENVKFNSFNNDLEPKPNDYCILDLNPSLFSNDMITYMSNNIGQILKINTNFIIVYENIPKKLTKYFYIRNYKYKKFSINLDDNDIIQIHFSSNKEELEFYLDTKKFNL